MADERNRNRKQESDEDRLRRELRRDPEFEVPDPDQVKKDIESAEEEYAGDQKKKPA
jgi:hypothetical protein